MDLWQGIAIYAVIAFGVHQYLVYRAKKNSGNPYAFWRTSS